MAQPTQYTSATKMGNPISSSLFLEEALVCIGPFTNLTLFTKAAKSNKTHLKCYVHQLKQSTAGAKDHHRHGRCEEKWTRASPPASRGLAAKPTSSKPAHQRESKTQGTPRQPPFPGNTPITIFTSRGEEKEVERTQSTHMLSCPICLQKRMAALCSHALIEQAAVQLGGCFFRTAASS